MQEVGRAERPDLWQRGNDSGPAPTDSDFLDFADSEETKLSRASGRTFLVSPNLAERLLHLSPS